MFKQLSKKKKHEKQGIPKSCQKTIPYKKVFNDGIIEVKSGYFSKTIVFEDINYLIARKEEQEEIFLKYGEFLNFFDPAIDVQITINNKNINRQKFEEDILLPLRNDSLNNYRKEYNNMLKLQIDKGRNDIIREKYITYTLEADNVNEARVVFSRLDSEILANLAKIGSNARLLSTVERLQIIHDFYNIGNEEHYLKSAASMIKMGITHKDLIAPPSFLFKYNYFQMGDKFARAIFLRDLPTYLNDRFISELTDFSFNMMLTINVNSVAPEEAIKIVKKQITGMEGNKIEYQRRALKSGYSSDIIPHELQHSLKEAGELLDELINHNQKMFLVSVILVHTADSLNELNRDTETITSVARKYLCGMATLNYQQEDAVASTLPLGNNRLKLQRTLTTESASVLLPFTSQEVIQKGGTYYGLNAVSNNLIIFNRTNLKNPNGFILGSPGSGKSFAAKREMVNILLNTNDDVICLDPEAEYTTMARNLGGEVIKISAASKNYINPLDLNMNYSDEDSPLLLKSEFILSLFECLTGGKNGLTPKEKTILDRCLHKTYTEYLQEFDEGKIPTLLDFYKVLEQQVEPEAKELLVALEIYVKGSLAIFANRTNINTNNRFIIYDIKDLGKQLKTVGMLIVLDAIWNRITRNRAIGKRTYIYLDEIYLLFSNEYSANFLFELYKRARKWGAVPNGITQNIEDLLNSELARRMLSNSDFLMLLNQAPVDRAELAKLLNISDAQLNYISNSEAGQGLLFTGNYIIPFIDKFPTNTDLYKMMTTRVDEMQEFQKKLNKEGDNKW